MIEDWNPIPNLMGYEASSLGRIRSTRKVLTARKNKNGYLMVTCGRGNSVWVHRAVLCAFRGVKPAPWQTSHLNGIKDDNRLDNLIWEMPGDNYRRNKSQGRERKLSLADVQSLKAEIIKGENRRYLADKYKVSISSINMIAAGFNHSEVQAK